MEKAYRNLFIVLFAFGVMTSCSKNKQAVPKADNKTLIIGVWDYIKAATYFQADGGTKRVLAGEVDVNGSYEFTSDHKLLIEGEAAKTYKVNNTSLAISTDTEVATNYTITKLDAKKLVFESLIASSTDYNGQHGSLYIVGTFSRSSGL